MTAGVTAFGESLGWVMPVGVQPAVPHKMMLARARVCFMAMYVLAKRANGCRCRM